MHTPGRQVRVPRAEMRHGPRRESTRASEPLAPKASRPPSQWELSQPPWFKTHASHPHRDQVRVQVSRAQHSRAALRDRQDQSQRRDSPATLCPRPAASKFCRAWGGARSRPNLGPPHLCPGPLEAPHGTCPVAPWAGTPSSLPRTHWRSPLKVTHTWPEATSHVFVAPCSPSLASYCGHPILSGQ